MKEFQPRKCPFCEGTWRAHDDGVFNFKHARHEYSVDGQHYAVCDNCSTEGYLPGQRDENRRMIADFQSKLPDYISPSDVLAVREKYRISQEVANKLFGGGKQGFSKWERGLVEPSGVTARLLKLALESPDVVRSLARMAAVTLDLSKFDAPKDLKRKTAEVRTWVISATHEHSDNLINDSFESFSECPPSQRQTRSTSSYLN